MGTSTQWQLNKPETIPGAAAVAMEIKADFYTKEMCRGEDKVRWAHQQHRRFRGRLRKNTLRCPKLM